MCHRLIDILAEFKNAERSKIQWIDADSEDKYDCVRFTSSDGIEYVLVMDGLKIVNVCCYPYMSELLK